MCMIHDCDEPFELFFSSIKKASRKHRCCECLRIIQIGEKYNFIKVLYEKRWDAYHTCAHCNAAKEWLNKHCGGWLLRMLDEDLNEHFGEGYREDNLGRLIVGIKRKWKKFKSDDLFPIPKIENTNSQLSNSK